MRPGVCCGLWRGGGFAEGGEGCDGDPKTAEVFLAKEDSPCAEPVSPLQQNPRNSGFSATPSEPRQGQVPADSGSRRGFRPEVSRKDRSPVHEEQQP